MISLILALQAAAPASEMQSSMQPVSVEEGVSLFKRICFDPFPDPARSLAVIAEPELALTQLPETPSQAMQPGDSWSSPTAMVGYVNADWLPRDFGSPQCSVTVAVAGSPAHLDVEAAAASALGLSAAKGGKKRSQSQWDLPQTSGSWRIFLSTQATPSGTEMRMIVMNLRGKAK